MISWALKRNSDSTRDAPVSDDTTQIEQPDTPAPVFAVRALKSALFGTPAPRDRRPAPKTAGEKTAKQNANPQPLTDKSPARLPGILLTPGTGTARRKRVSFGHDVKQGSGGPVRTSTSGLPDECPGKFPSPWVDRNADSGQSRLKTGLQQALEGSRKDNNKDGGTDEKDFAYPGTEPEDVWEEVDDDESEYDADVTTDLNEPHSRSGKYWKSHFENYHTDAKAEMEKLVKYKQLAKSYAKMKDAEALELSQKLKEEQEKVKALEEKIAEISRQSAITAKRKPETGSGLLDELDRQTALATEYKQQVEELEALLQENIDEAEDGRPRQCRVASPRTQRTILETQRELRRARSQIRELEKLQEERDRLRSDLRSAEQRATKLAEENRKLSGELSQSTTRIQDLEKKLEDSRGLYEKLKDDAKARYLEAQQVLQKKNEKISELQEEIGTLRKDGAEPRRAPRSVRATSLDEKVTALQALESAEEGNARLKDVNETGKRQHRGTEGSKRTSYDDATLASSRALRERIEAEFGTKQQPAAAVFGDRGNLQDSSSSASSGRSAHPRENQPRRVRIDHRSKSGRATTAESKATNGDRVEKRPISRTLSELARRQPGRALTSETQGLEADPVQTKSARVGGADPNSSAAWSIVNTSRTTMPAARRAAAIARLQRKRAERGMQQLDRNKENDKPC
ncbi:hypothetical protein VTK56DRAFT_940 [Thermocarpiscus australiensis]